MSALVTLSESENNVSASEWWNGEGIDFTIQKKSYQDEITHSFNMEELEVIFAIAIAFKMVDIRECKAIARRLRGENESKNLE